jgi:hypothetical protein
MTTLVIQVNSEENLCGECSKVLHFQIGTICGTWCGVFSKQLRTVRRYARGIGGIEEKYERLVECKQAQQGIA